METMDKRLLWSIAGGVVLIIAIGTGLYQYKHHHAAPADTPSVSEEAAVIPRAAIPAIQHPLPAAAQTERLPALDESDSTFQQQLTTLFGTQLNELLVPDSIIRHVVATVDNLPRKKLAIQLRPVKPVAGQFQVGGTEDTPILAADNSARYSPYVKLLQSADPDQAVALYLRYYPLLQQAYQNLGNPTTYFNDRVIEAIDDVLAAPELTGPIKLVQPNVFYQFADPDLEGRSAGQKLLLRMGEENATIVKAKLREIRSRIATAPAVP